MSTGDWRSLAAELRCETRRIWLDEPHEVTLIRNGLILTGAGSNGQYYSVLVHLEGFLMYLAPHVVYRLLILAQNPRLDLTAVRDVTSTMLGGGFDVFRLLGDMGLRTAHGLGTRYMEALAGLETKNDYLELTGALLTYLNRVYQWVHFIFPWSIGSVFPTKRTADVVQQLEAIRRWEEETVPASTSAESANHGNGLTTIGTRP